MRINMRDFDGPEEFLESLRDADIARTPSSLLYVQAMKFLQTKTGPERRSEFAPRRPQAAFEATRQLTLRITPAAVGPNSAALASGRASANSRTNKMATSSTARGTREPGSPVNLPPLG